MLAPYQTVKDNPVVLRASYVLGYSPATTFRRAMTGKINPDDLACMLVECGVARPESKKKCEDRYRRELKTPILHKVNLSTVPKAKVLRRGGGPPGSEIPNPRLYAPSRTILALHNQAFVDAVSGEPEAFVLCKHLETAEVLYKKRILEQVKTKTKWIDTVKLALEKSSADETIREDIRKKIAGKSVFWTSEGDKNKPERHLKTYLECYDRCDIEVWELGGLPDTFIKINYGDVAERAWQRLCARIGIPMRDSYSLVCILAIAYGEQWPIVLREDANTFYAFPKAKKDKYKLSHVAHVTVPSEGQPKCECGKTLAAPPPVAPPREAAKVESKKEEEQKPETKKIPHTPPAQPPPPPPPEPKPTVASVPVPPKPAESKIPSKPAEPAGPLPVVAPEPTPAAVPTPVAVVPAAVLVPPPPPIPPRDAPREQPPSAIPSRSTSPITASDLTKGGTILKHVEPSQGKVAKPEPPGGQRSMASALADAMAARRPSLAESAEDVEDEPQDFGDDAKCVARQFPGNVGTFTEFMACI